MSDLTSNSSISGGFRSADRALPDPQSELIPPLTSGSHTPVSGARDATHCQGLPHRSADNAETVVLSQLSLEPGRREGSLGRMGSYEILEIIGRGGMGVVLRAFDTVLHRIVAIKVMTPSLLLEPTSRERFLREARSAAGISHNNVVTVYAVNEHAGNPYLVMEYVEGTTLQRWIRSHRVFSDREVVDIIQQSALGLAAAHRQLIVHRDIKPGNIIVEERTGRIKVTDFGLARAVFDTEDMTASGGIVGTPSFMSPEQVAGGKLDCRSDLFSLGCVIYSLYAGHSPFRADNAFSAASKVLHTPHVPLRTLFPDIPVFIADLVDSLLEKDPDRRPQTADNVATIVTQGYSRWKLPDVEDTLQWTPKMPVLLRSRIARRSWQAAVLAVALLVPASWFAWDWWTSQNALVVQPTKRVPVSIAVAPQPNTVVTVAQNGSAQFKDLYEALNAAGPGGRIEIQDEGPYEARILIDDPARYSGIRLISVAPGGTRLRHQGVEPILQISNCDHVRIENLRFETGSLQHGITLQGSCPGAWIENCHFEPLPINQELWATAHLRRGATGSELEPIVFYRCRFKSRSVNLVVGAPNDLYPCRNILVQECLFEGTSREAGVNLVLQRGGNNIRITRNIFRNGARAIAITAAQELAFQNVAISFNTFDRLATLVYFEQTEPHQELEIRDNLVLMCGGLASPDQFNTAFYPLFRNNWWEPANHSEEHIFASFANIQKSVPLLSRDPDHPDYLKPAADASPRLPGRYAAVEGSLRSSTQ